MATQSKVESNDFLDVIRDLLLGSRKKQMVSGAILVIIAFLIHIRNLNNGSDNIKLKPRIKDKKKVILWDYAGRQG